MATKRKTIKVEVPYWFRVIARAQEKKENGAIDPFTEKEIKKSGNWTTCACGHQDPRIPRHGPDSYEEEGFPLDDNLSSLGYDFFMAVQDQNPELAAVKLLQIEARAAIVLQRELRRRERHRKAKK